MIHLICRSIVLDQLGFYVECNQCRFFNFISKKTVYLSFRTLTRIVAQKEKDRKNKKNFKQYVLNSLMANFKRALKLGFLYKKCLSSWFFIDKAKRSKFLDLLSSFGLLAISTRQPSVINSDWWSTMTWQSSKWTESI